MSDSWRLEDDQRPHGTAEGTGPRVLLLGATGMLGRAFAAELTARGTPFRAPPRTELDLSDLRAVERFVSHDRSVPPVIIYCAAWTDVDGAEANEADATRVNAEALRILARLTAFDIRIVNFSTDYVFSGDAAAPYPVDAPRAPLNAYGRSKAAGEEVLESLLSADNWLNIRTSWLYAPWGKNFVLTMKRMLHEKPLVKVVNDQRGRPTSAQHLARTTLTLIERRVHGHYHATDGGECTWYEFAAEIKRLAKAPAAVEPCSTAAFPRPARRPGYSVLDIARTEEVTGRMPDWKTNLADVLLALGP